MDRLKRALDGIQKIKLTRRTLFSALGMVMAVVVVGVIVWLSTFLANQINEALTADPHAAPSVRFDIEGFEKLQLTK
ncbi:MAG: hypothetical protein HYU81_00885 [Candidatus Brennerbacteria bacterium]|nr:hypothetical protein [Candidatus Brennerbacteria bacterium]